MLSMTHSNQGGCIALGLYDSDDEWNAYSEEAVNMKIGAQLRSLFVTILAFGVPGEPCMLWDKYKSTFAMTARQHYNVVV